MCTRASSIYVPTPDLKLQEETSDYLVKPPLGILTMNILQF